MSVVAAQLRATVSRAKARQGSVAAEDERHEEASPLQELHCGVGCRESWAVFSPDRKWRYRMVRVWDSDKPRLGWVVLNGSGPDEHRTDATVRRCIGFARAWGYGGVDIANLYGLVSKNPGALAHHFDPVGPDNDHHLAAVCSENDLTMLAWGPTAGTERAHAVLQMLWRLAKRHGGSLGVVGGAPGAHPLPTRRG